jgi:hypothetical protein
MAPEAPKQADEAVPEKAAGDSEAVAEAKSAVDPTPDEGINAEKAAAVEAEEGMTSDAALNKALADPVIPDEGA